MKNLLKVLDIFKKKIVSKSNSKKDASINFNSTLYFQVGLIVSIITVALIINATYGESVKPIGPTFSYDHDEPFHLDQFIIQKPEVPKPVVEEKLVARKLITDVIKVVKKPTVDNSEDPLITEPPVIVVDLPVPVKPAKPAVEEPKAYLALGVERAPVFPGCEALTNNKARIDCMTYEIGKIINRRFDKDLAAAIGLNGQQRIYVTFTISKTGEVVDVKVRAPHPRLEKEALKVINLIPKMLPGIQSDRNVDVLFSLPIILNVT